MKRALVATLVALVALPGAAAAAGESTTSGPVPVLGSKSFARPYGAGFGTAKPEAIFNGGDPNGEVSKIHWKGWGEPSAIGTGLEPIFRPGGGYFHKPALVELRATKLGKCGRQAAYTRLEVRAPRHPGGKLGGWRLWSGAKTICEPPH